MILRPSKIFVSLHQLRHYVQTKISELVVTTHQQPSMAVTQLANYSTTQQSIIFFSDIQRSLIQKAYYFQQPMKRNPINEKLLLKVIQRHFPIAKVFSQPTIHSRSMMWATTQPTLQFRTMMSSSSSGGGNTFLTYGFPRSAMVGLGRNNGFGATRQFSTTKTPCVTFFQNTQQPNVIAHISSRIFSPVGTKITQPVTTDEKPKFVPFYSSEKDLSSSEEDEESVCSDKYHYISMFSHQQDNKGIAELVDMQAQETNKQLYVGREITRDRCVKRKVGKKLDSIIRHDEISSLHSNIQTKRKLNGSIISRHYRTKHPPDRHGGKKITTSVYLLIDLNSIPFTSSWTTETLNPNFIDSLENLVKTYRMRIYHVLNLLDRLRFSGKKFRVVSRNSELRIYFPSSATLNTKLEAIEYLKRIQVDQDEEYYTIVVENSNNVSDFTLNETVSTDYFKELQSFLDRTDYLIETSNSIFSR